MGTPRVPLRSQRTSPTSVHLSNLRALFRSQSIHKIVGILTPDICKVITANPSARICGRIIIYGDSQRTLEISAHFSDLSALFRPQSTFPISEHTSDCRSTHSRYMQSYYRESECSDLRKDYDI
jgi:hypothetical protein